MKKALLFILAASMLLSLAGCATSAPETSAPSVSEDASSMAESVTEESSNDVSETVSQEEERPMISIKGDPNYANVALNKSYTHTTLHPGNDNASYPDEGGISMTDGVIAAADGKYSDPAFMGFNKNHNDYTAKGYSAVTVDLGGLHYLDKFVAHVASKKHLSVGINAPEIVFIYVSHDGETWHRVGYTSHEDSETVASIPSTLELEYAVSARYVQYRFLGDSNWIFVCEVEAFGIAAEEEIPFPGEEEIVSFLFVGNSSTYYFNIPVKFMHLAASAGVTVEVDNSCVGSAYLSYFADAANERHGIPLREHLASKKYDYVVLQDNSGASYEDSKPAIDILLPLIKENGAEMLLYKRYSSNDDPAQRLDSAYRHEVNYSKLAETFGVDRVAPGADAFLICTEKYPEINLYHTDNSHHGAGEGAYLLACVMAIEFLDLDLDKCTYTAGLDEATVAKLKECAKIACETGYDYPQK
ncbi:MAG: hypothetical protein IKK06_00555 [Clostridia bacterium]|nr:hypothetical protein [Clostridia bacterium]